MLCYFKLEHDLAMVKTNDVGLFINRSLSDVKKNTVSTFAILI